MFKTKKLKINTLFKGFFSKFNLNLLLISLSSAAFFFIVLNRKPNIIRPVSLLVQFRPYLSLPLIGLFLFLILSIKNESIKKPAAFILVITIFALSLAGIWANTQTENYLIAGLIPRSDASYQYTGALRLLDFGKLNGSTSRRPFFGELLAILLALTNRNLQITVAIIAFLTAVAAWYAALEINNSFSKVSSILFLFLVFLYYSRFIGTTMTENLGLIFGLLSFTFYIRAFKLITNNQTESIKFYIIGTFLFSMGQNARPGAVLMIPFFVLFSGMIFHDERKAFNWKMALFSMIASVLALIINQLHFIINGYENSTLMSNMLYGIYGFIKGGMGWNQIFIDHPDISNLPVIDQNRQILYYAFLELVKNPKNILIGFLNEFKHLFEFNSQIGLLSFIQLDSSLINLLFSCIMVFLYGLGLFRIFAERKPLIRLFLISIFLGFIFSLPFSPASQTQYMRVYAGSIPFLIFISIYGLGLILSRFPEKFQSIIKTESVSLDGRLFSAIVASMVIFSPLALKFINLKAPDNYTECPKNLSASVVFFNPGSVINVVEDNKIILDWVPDIHQAKFRSKIHNICCDNAVSFFEGLSAPVSIFTSIDNSDGISRYYVIADSGMLPAEKGWLQLCGMVTNSVGDPAERGFYFPKIINRLN